MTADLDDIDLGNKIKVTINYIKFLKKQQLSDHHSAMEQNDCEEKLKIEEAKLKKFKKEYPEYFI